MAEFMGSSCFFCSVMSYMISWSKQWWIQKGSVRIEHLGNNANRWQEISHTSWLSDDKDAAPWKWPVSNAILVDDYSPVRTCKGYAEKLIVSKVCSQIIHTCICNSPASWRWSERNKLKQFCGVQKAGVLKGIHRKITRDLFSQHHLRQWPLHAIQHSDNNKTIIDPYTLTAWPTKDFLPKWNPTEPYRNKQGTH